MQPNRILRTLDQMIQARSILNHPCYRHWLNGELSQNQLAIYAEVYYPHVAAFPGYLECAIQASDDWLVRDELERNLADELTRPKAHPELWLDFAEGLGLERRGVTSASWRPAAQNMVDTFDHLARGESSQALATLYAYESQQPEVAGEKAFGLRNRYGVQDGKTLAYFDVHAEADVEHRAGGRLALAYCLVNGESAELALEAAGQALNAYWRLLDGRQGSLQRRGHGDHLSERPRGEGSSPAAGRISGPWGNGCCNRGRSATGRWTAPARRPSEGPAPEGGTGSVAWSGEGVIRDAGNGPERIIHPEGHAAS